MLMNVVIPSLGDIDEVEVIEICVAVDDDIEEHEGLIVIESDKASMEVPSPTGGVVTEICVTVGEMVGEGHLVAKVDVVESAAEKDTELEISDLKEIEPVEDGPESAISAKIDILVPDLAVSTRAIVTDLNLSVGQTIAVNSMIIELETDDERFEVVSEHDGTIVEVYIKKGDPVSTGDLVAKMELNSVDALSPGLSESTDKSNIDEVSKSINGSEAAIQNAPASVYAGPAVRRLAREYGVSLGEVAGSGSRGRITKDDLKAFVKNKLNEQNAGAAEAGSVVQVESVDYSKFGDTYSSELSRIQQVGAKNLYASWVNVPHVTQHDKVDVTDLESFREALNREAETADHKITPLAFIIRACCLALEKYPIFNSSLEPSHQSILINRFYNIGFAVDTSEGLVVPVIKDSDKKGISQLSSEIIELSKNAREKKLGLGDLQGGTFTISSLGALGGTGFTPIVNAPQVAILGVARLMTEPEWDGEQFLPRKMLPLSLSYDHRVINGADGGRFMLFLTGLLGDIRRFSL